MSTNNIDIAENLYDKDENILYGDNNNINNSFAGLVLLQDTKNMKYLSNEIDKLSSNNGLLVYSYDKLLDITNDTAILYHIRLLQRFGLKPLARININNKSFMLSRKVPVALLKRMKESDYVSIFKQDDISIDELNNGDILNFRMTTGKSAHIFYEKTMPEYKLRKIKSYKSNIPKLIHSKLTKQYIKMPNIEQAAILLASGKFENELVLKDGRKMIFKGTDSIFEDQKYSYNLYSEIDSIRYIKKRNTVVIGLDITNHEFVRFE